MKALPKPISFQWDAGNWDKNFIKHKVSSSEIEEAFFDKNKRIFNDLVHSNKEKRCRIIAKTTKNRILFVVFTLRGGQLRVISARDLNKKEEYLYEKNA